MKLVKTDICEYVRQICGELVSQLERAGFEYEFYILHADETVLEVLCEPGREASTQSYMWLYRTGREDTPIVLYEYTQGRSGNYAKKFLKGFLPKSKLGEAISYSLKQRKYMKGFLLDRRLEISNNRAERSIKPFVIGRKNWLFSNTPKVADASAVIYSLIEKAKGNDLDPFLYLQYLFEQLPNVDIQNPEILKKYLPWSKELPQICRNLQQ